MQSAWKNARALYRAVTIAVGNIIACCLVNLVESVAKIAVFTIDGIFHGASPSRIRLLLHSLSASVSMTPSMATTFMNAISTGDHSLFTNSYCKCICNVSLHDYCEELSKKGRNLGFLGIKRDEILDK